MKNIQDKLTNCKVNYINPETLTDSDAVEIIEACRMSVRFLPNGLCRLVDFSQGTRVEITAKGVFAAVQKWAEDFNKRNKY